MTETAFSNRYKSELDPEQLLARMRSVPIDRILPEDEIAPKERELIRSDVVCPSCGATGAQIVRASKGRKTAKAVRKSHFRFVSAAEEDAHHKFCEFSTEALGESKEPLIGFGKARSAETRFIRELVCKGIENGIFNQQSIRAMRQWFFDLKSTTRIHVTATSEAVDWMEALWRHPHYRRWPFRPVHAELPNFNWEQAAKNQFTEDNIDLLEWLFKRRKESSFPNAYGRAKVLSGKYYGQEVFDTSVLRPFYEKTIDLASFVAQNSEFPNKKHSAYYQSQGAPDFLLALCALLLFMSDWNMDDAVGLFAKLLKAPNSSDETLGNVMGLNPFHDYAAWETLTIASELAAQSVADFDYKAQLGTTKLRITEEYRLWQAHHG